MGNLYKRVARLPTLRKAWAVVRASAQQSNSEATKEAVETFSKEVDKNLKKIQQRLKSSTFKFLPAHGVPIKKPGKTSIRPIVITPIETRIIQRAILDVILTKREITAVLHAGFNYGGISEGGVPKAIEAAYKASIENNYFIRSDIQAFFDRIPREKAVELITKHTNDPEFNALLIKATTVELDNLAKLGPHRDKFPLDEHGVAQGSCLSPILCNLLLHEFDLKLNSHGIRTIRYIDDFIIFASSARKAYQALKIARTTLKSLNLDAYDPKVSSDKAEEGHTAEGFDFLGCRINPDGIRPGKKAKQSLIEKVRTILRNTVASQAYLPSTSGTSPSAGDLNYLSGLWKVSNTIRAWGNTFSFCTDDRIFVELDHLVEQELKKFRTDFRKKLIELSSSERRRMLGIHQLNECKKDEKFRLLVAAHARSKSSKVAA